MKKMIVVLALFFIMASLGGLSCSPGIATPAVFTSPRDWTPPVFPGAVRDEQIQGDMTEVAATPQVLDETAWICFGFPVHNAVFYAYRSDASQQDIIDFYDEQMVVQGWKEIANDLSEATLPHRIWQYQADGPLVAYLMVAPMEDGRNLIYISVAESSIPQEVIED